MQLLKEIERQKNTKKSGREVRRDAVRSIIIKENKLLMVYSSVNGDYKFPGGGVEKGESFYDALKRETAEECGAKIISIEGEFGKIIEYDIPKEIDFDVFKMTSYYYFCKVEELFFEQKLDIYEKQLDFKPVWIEIGKAIENNTSLMKSGQKYPYWVIRDTFVLEELKKYLNELLTEKP